MPNFNPGREELLRYLQWRVIDAYDDEEAEEYQRLIQALQEDKAYIEHLEAKIARLEFEQRTEEAGFYSDWLDELEGNHG